MPKHDGRPIDNPKSSPTFAEGDATPTRSHGHAKPAASRAHAEGNPESGTSTATQGKIEKQHAELLGAQKPQRHDK